MISDLDRAYSPLLVEQPQLSILPVEHGFQKLTCCKLLGEIHNPVKRHQVQDRRLLGFRLLNDWQTRTDLPGWGLPDLERQ